MRTQYPTNEAQRLAALQSYGLLARRFFVRHRLRLFR